MIERTCDCCLPVSKEQWAKNEAEYERLYPTAKPSNPTDNEHDREHDMRGLAVPPPMSKEDKENYGVFE